MTELKNRGVEDILIASVDGLKGFPEAIAAVAHCHRAGIRVKMITGDHALTARSIADAYRHFMPEPVEEVLISGGGSKNLALMDLLASALAPIAVRRFDEVYFDGEAKEAVAFALLAKLHIDGIAGLDGDQLDVDSLELDSPGVQALKDAGRPLVPVVGIS